MSRVSFQSLLMSRDKHEQRARAPSRKLLNMPSYRSRLRSRPSDATSSNSALELYQTRGRQAAEELETTSEHFSSTKEHETQSGPREGSCR